MLEKIMKMLRIDILAGVNSTLTLPQSKWLLEVLQKQERSPWKAVGTDLPEPGFVVLVAIDTGDGFCTCAAFRDYHGVWTDARCPDYTVPNVAYWTEIPKTPEHWTS